MEAHGARVWGQVNGAFKSSLRIELHVGDNLHMMYSVPLKAGSKVAWYAHDRGYVSKEDHCLTSPCAIK